MLLHKTTTNMDNLPHGDYSVALYLNRLKLDTVWCVVGAGEEMGELLAAAASEEAPPPPLLMMMMMINLYKYVFMSLLHAKFPPGAVS